MFFKLSRIFLTLGFIFLIGFSAYLSKKTSIGSFTAKREKQYSSLDSIAKNTGTITRFDHLQANETGSKEGKETHSSLNSVNLIIYMIYKVTNKSL